MTLQDPASWRLKFHKFVRAKKIAQPVDLAKKTGATGSSPMFLLAFGCMLGVALADREFQLVKPLRQNQKKRERKKPDLSLLIH